MSTQGYLQVNGTDEAANGDVDKEIIAGVAGEIIRVKNIFISVTVAAAGGGGEVALEDSAGGTRFVEIDADAVGSYSIDFGEMGYPMTAGNSVNLTVDGAVTTQATATATIVGIRS